MSALRQFNGILEPLEPRRLLAGFAPDSIKGWGFEVSSPTLDPADGPVHAFAAPAGNEFLVFQDSSLVLFGTYSYERTGDNTGTFEGNAVFLGSLTGTFTFTSATKATGTLSADGQTFEGSVNVLTTHGPNAFFDPPEEGEDDGGLLVYGSDGNDVVGISVKDGKLRANVNGRIEAFPASIVERLRVVTGDGADVVTLGGGVPSAYLDGGAGNDRLEGGNGNDTVTAGAGRNTLFGHAGDDQLNGSGGRDFLNGGDGADRLYGRGGDDLLDGGGGIDRLFGGDGNDLLLGGSSNDKLYGQAGNDTLNGQKHADLVDGGAGTDSRLFDSLDTAVSVEQFG